MEELEKNLHELIKRYNKLKEENAHLLKKIKEKEKDVEIMKLKLEDNDTKRIRAVNRLTKVIEKIEEFISEEINSEIKTGRGNE